MQPHKLDVSTRVYARQRAPTVSVVIGKTLPVIRVFVLTLTSVHVIFAT